ncbi:hypothetical protein ACSBR2_035543 [Camellia fascicularis]
MDNSLFLMCKFRGVTLVIKGFGEVMVGLVLSCNIHRIDVFVKCFSLSECHMICNGEASSSSVICENDFLPSFYSNQWKPLLSDVGKRFTRGVVEFRDALSKYSIHFGFDFDIVKNDKDHVTVHDKHRVTSVHARLENSNKAFVIKQFDDVHTCRSSFRIVKHARMTSSMIGGLISSNVRNKPLASVSVVVCDFKDYYGIEVSYQRTWMGVEKARGSIFGDYSLSFDDFRWYVDAANDANPRSVFDMEFDVDSKGRHFKRLFLAFEACIHGFKYC